MQFPKTLHAPFLVNREKQKLLSFM